MGKQEIFNLQPLFEDIQLQTVFADSKTFVDCTPLFNLSVIQHKYEEQKSRQGFDLSTFVNEHFILPKAYSTNYASVKGRQIVEHIQMLWDVLTRQPEEEKSSLIPLPHPYIVPGGRFREIFYWDSYFTMLGLQVSGRSDMIQNMTDNFSYLIDKFGYIPNGNRTYFLGRSQPPFFALIVKLLSQEKSLGKDGGDTNILIKYLPQLVKEYNFWMRGSDRLDEKNNSIYRVALMPDKSILNHYWDESDTPRPESYKEDVELAKKASNKTGIYRNIRAACESGWDFSSRWFKIENDFSSIHTTEIIPVDLNCLLYNLEQTIAEAYLLCDEKKSSDEYQTAANKRKEAINHYCWNKDESFYYDYDYVEGKHKNILTLAATFPLFFKIAASEQSENVATHLQKSFLYPGGLQTTTIKTGQQWDSPNGWAPLQWIAINGLINYGHDNLAKDIAKRWIGLNNKVYENTGKMMEKYNVVSTYLEAGGGEYQSQDGFGWTNGVYLALNKSMK